VTKEGGNKTEIPDAIESPNKTPNKLPNHNFYKCENCIMCEHCGVTKAGKKRLNKWSKDFKLCSDCNKKKKNK
jgi:hypothetical protein